MTPRRMSGETYERLRRRAAAIEACTLFDGPLTESLWIERTADLSPAARTVVMAWLPVELQAEYDADRGRS